MWISNKLKSSEQKPFVEAQSVTASGKGGIEAVGSSVERQLSVFSPYGYSYSLPAGEKLLIVSGEGVKAGVGVVMDSSLKKGEVRISNAFGVSFLLSADGTVEIKANKITLNGEVIANE